MAELHLRLARFPSTWRRTRAFAGLPTTHEANPETTRVLRQHFYDHGTLCPDVMATLILNEQVARSAHVQLAFLCRSQEEQ